MASRWGALIAAGGVMWGLNFVYDLPASLSTPLQIYLEYSGEEFAYLVSTLYTVYAVPNIVLPFVSGFAVQRYGEYSIWILCIISMLFGQIIFAIGVQVKGRLLLVAGRIFLGFGGETTVVLTSDLITRRFQNDRLVLALATIMVIATLGTVANTFITPRLVHTNGVVSATWLVSIAGVLACTSGVASILRLDVKPTANHHRHQPSQKVNVLGMLKQMPPQYWQLCMICITVYGCIFPFNNSAQQFLATTFYNGDETTAGSVVGITHIISGCLTFPFGWLLEQPRFKNSPVPLVISSAILLLAHILFLMHALGPLLPISLLGITNGLFAVAFLPIVASSILNDSLPIPGRYKHLRPHQHTGDHESSSSIYLAPILQNLDSPIEPYDSSDDGDERRTFNRGHDDDDREAGGEKSKEALLVVGYGIMTSATNLSVAVMPVILAITKTIAGYTGLETVFAGLAAAGVFTSAQLVRNFK